MSRGRRPEGRPQGRNKMDSMDKQRIEELEALAYFEWGLSEMDAEELDHLIKNCDTTLENRKTKANGRRG